MPDDPVRIAVTERNFPDIRFRTASPLEAGALLRLRANGVSMLSSVEISRVYLADSPDTELAIVHRYRREEMETDWMWYIRTKSMAVVEAPRRLDAGIEVIVESRYRSPGRSSSGAGIIQVRYSGLTWKMLFDAVESVRSESGTSVAEPASLFFVAGPVDRIESYLKPGGRVLVTGFDAFGNPVEAAHTVEVDLDADDRSSLPSADASLQWRATGERIRISAHGRSALSNAKPQALDGTPIWFGEFHWHTDFSGDGQRPMRDALTAARDELGLDFAGPADHMGPNGRYGGIDPNRQAEICRSFDEPGRFVTVPAAELSRRYGHTNLYADSFDTFLSIVGRFEKNLAPAWSKEPDRYDFASLARLCVAGKSVIVPHHANMDSFVREHVVHDDGRPFWCAMHYPLPPDRVTVRLFEMVQSRGAFETEVADDVWRTYDGGLGGSARTALTRGYRMGFVAGTDNHCGWPTRWGADYSGITAIQAEILDTAALFDAMFRRRCYATSGARIVADVTLNGSPMGSELLQSPGEERVFRIKVRGTTELTHVQIVHLGYVLKNFDLLRGSLDFDVEWADDRPGRPLEDAWYYVRIRQADGHCAWLSPFWVDLR